MNNKNWAKIKWIMSFLLEWKKKGYPIAYTGKCILLAGFAPWMATSISATLEIDSGHFIKQLSLDLGNSSLLAESLSIIVMAFGASLIVYDIFRIQKKQD